MSTPYPSCRKAAGLSWTKDRTSHSRIPALRCAAAGMTILIAGCGAIAQDTCNDHGGVWDDSIDECHCSYVQQGTYAETPSPEQLAWRTWCAGPTDVDSIKKKAAATPAPTGE
ncbi:MAG: hypothetical protein AAF225_05625 [Pseudomonadota bacterium]